MELTKFKDFLESLNENKEDSLDEATKDYSSVASKVKKLTANNDHTNAYILVSKSVGLKKYEKIFDLISQIQNLEGSLSDNLSKFRYDMYKEMVKYGSQKIGKDDFDKYFRSNL